MFKPGDPDYNEAVKAVLRSNIIEYLVVMRKLARSSISQSVVLDLEVRGLIERTEEGKYAMTELAEDSVDLWLEQHGQAGVEKIVQRLLHTEPVRFDDTEHSSR